MDVLEAARLAARAVGGAAVMETVARLGRARAEAMVVVTVAMMAAVAAVAVAALAAWVMVAVGAAGSMGRVHRPGT